MQVKIAFGKYIVLMDSWLVTLRNCNQILSEYAMGKTAIYLYIYSLKITQNIVVYGWLEIFMTNTFPLCNSVHMLPHNTCFL